MSFKKGHALNLSKGFTLIEVIVVTLILSILALIGVETIVGFQKNAILESTAKELVSTIRTAQNKSLAGELLTGEVLQPNDLPKYGIDFSTSSYTLFRDYVGVGSSAIEVYPIDTQLTLITLTPSTQVVFDRVSGTSSPTNLKLERLDNGENIQINISKEGLVTLIK